MYVFLVRNRPGHRCYIDASDVGNAHSGCVMLLRHDSTSCYVIPASHVTSYQSVRLLPHTSTSCHVMLAYHVTLIMHVPACTYCLILQRHTRASGYCLMPALHSTSYQHVMSRYNSASATLCHVMRVPPYTYTVSVCHVTSYQGIMPRHTSASCYSFMPVRHVNSCQRVMF